MRVTAVELRDFRGYERAGVRLGKGLTVISGANGAGKTNLLEALYFGVTGRSCRTSNERELVRFGAAGARVVVGAEGEDGSHELSVAFVPGQPKRIKVDGAPVERLEVTQRPLVSVFLPERLELVKGPPASRRAHLDQFVSALWPSRRTTRREYAQALAQRNALLGRIRAGSAPRSALGTWDTHLSRLGVELMADRGRAVETLEGRFTRLAAQLGLEAEAAVCYRPRSRATEPAKLAAELAERVDSDLERGFTGHGPHRDELSLRWGGRELRVYGSQGQQRLGLLALLLAEREALLAARSATPLMLLDDVMSELDGARRQALVELLRETPGQSVITTTELDHVPAARAADVTRVGVRGDSLLVEAVAA